MAFTERLRFVTLNSKIGSKSIEKRCCALLQRLTTGSATRPRMGLMGRGYRRAATLPGDRRARTPAQPSQNP
jgi:hypothetical protein